MIGWKRTRPGSRSSAVRRIILPTSWTREHGSRAALRIWRHGGIPSAFSVPVLCDGTAQSNMGMSYSLQMPQRDRGDGRQPDGGAQLPRRLRDPELRQDAAGGRVSALAHLDTLRRLRGEAPVTAVFAPAHVLKGGTIPEDVRADLELLAADCRAAGSRGDRRGP